VINRNYNWLNETFLVADDDPSSCLLLNRILQKYGAVVKCVHNGEEALAALRQDRTITLAIIDIHMPLLNGFEVVLRAKNYRPEVIYIAYTADVVVVDQYKLLHSGFHTFLTKPVMPDKILEMVKQVLEIRKPTV